MASIKVAKRFGVRGVRAALSLDDSPPNGWVEVLRLHDALDLTKAVLMRTALQDAGAPLSAPADIR
jgi:hypothetical protein